MMMMGRHIAGIHYEHYLQYRMPRMDDDARAVLCCDVSPVDCEFGMEIGVAVH